MNNLKNATSDKYVQLESEIKTIRDSISNYTIIKHAVIRATITATMNHQPKYLVLSDVLKLSENGKDELKALYSNVIEPLELKLSVLRILTINDKSGLGAVRNILSPEEATIVENNAIKEFVNMLTEKLNQNMLDKRPNLKAVIIYPLIIPVVNTWRQFAPDFSNRLINGIKSAENDAGLKDIINKIDIPIGRRA